MSEIKDIFDSGFDPLLRRKREDTKMNTEQVFNNTPWSRTPSFGDFMRIDKGSIILNDGTDDRIIIGDLS